MAFEFIRQGNLLPNRDYDQHEVLPYFALNQTGLNGQLVTFVTGAQDPVTSEGYLNQQVAASYTNVYSARFAVSRRVRPATFGDTKWEIAGLTLYTTAEFDENGNRLVNLPDDVANARAFVTSGQAVPIVKRGQFTAFLSQFNGISSLIVGRCISNTGTYNGQGVLGGFAQIEVAL